MNPQTLTPIRDQTQLTQLGQVPRDMRLCGADRMGQLAHAKLLVPNEQDQAPESRLMG
jgi:hypothetical protein